VSQEIEADVSEGNWSMEVEPVAVNHDEAVKVVVVVDDGDDDDEQNDDIWLRADATPPPPSKSSNSAWPAYVGNVMAF